MQKINLTYKPTAKPNKIMNNFAKYYDLIYYDKNYNMECNFLISCIKKFGITESKTILDLACGTGKHSITLAKKKFDVTGIDISKTAITIAKKNSRTLKIKPTFLKKDMTKFQLNKKFDTCISMFSSFCYLLNKKQIIMMLNNVKNHLKPGGLFIFDFWNGNAIQNEHPSTKVKIIKSGSRRIIRIATPTTDFKKNKCAINYHCIILNNKTITDEFAEIHTMRYHFPNNLIKLLKNIGFEILKITTINDTHFTYPYNSTSTKWYLTIIARKK